MKNLTNKICTLKIFALYLYKKFKTRKIMKNLINRFNTIAKSFINQLKQESFSDWAKSASMATQGR